MAPNSMFGPINLPPEEDELTPEERELIRRIAQKVVERGMTVPAILFLESVKPLNYIGSQVMIFMEPFMHAILRSVNDYNLFRQMMEKRDNVERLLQKVEELDAIQEQKERKVRKKYKAEKKIRRRRFWRGLLGRELPEDTVPPKDDKQN
ncbi:MAG: hypothetical protein V3W18_06065 [candidate division Zixibacteria bacterium]